MKKQIDTKKEIELAISRIQHGMPKRVPQKRRLSIAAVAEEAGVSNATIHNRYPDIAEQVRRLTSQEYSKKIKEKQASLKKSEEQLYALRQEINQLKSDLVQSQSINLKLHKENELLKVKLEITGYPTK
ncbi:MAG: TetR family transcriptional regulator [Dissulfurispiraceae bacterium]